MRDRTKRRNYSAEEFRGEQSVRRSWGLEQRHARKMSRQYGSVAAAWTAYQDRVDELQAAAPSARAGEAGLPVSAGTGDMAEVGKVESEPVRSAVAASAQAAAVPLPPEAIELVPVTSPSVLAQPVTAEPAAAIRSGASVCEPVLSRAPTCEPSLPETVPAKPIPAEADLSAQARPDVSETVAAEPIPTGADLFAQFRPDVSAHVAAGSRPDRRAVAAFGRVSRASPQPRGTPEPAEHHCRCAGWWTGRASPGPATRAPGVRATLLGPAKTDRAGQRRHVGAAANSVEIEIRFWASGVLDTLAGPGCSVGGILLRM
jgi:hypothetical protein